MMTPTREIQSYSEKKTSFMPQKSFEGSSFLHNESRVLHREERKTGAFEYIQNKKRNERTYIELEKEKCELPHICLQEADENLLTDSGVKLRYGDAKSFAETARELESHLLKDFPLETYLQRTEVLNAALDMMVSTLDISVFHNSVFVLMKFIENSTKLYKFLLSPYNRFCDIRKFEKEESKEHINQIYPSNSELKWKESRISPDSLSTSTYSSYSLVYTMCEICTKSLDCCLQEEKIGGALTLYKRTIKAFTEIYKVCGSESFGDVFIKILNSFDFVFTSLNQMQNEKPVICILQAIIPALKIANSIFNEEKYQDEAAGHPKLEILVSSTLMLQKYLRKYLFEHIFSENDAQIVCEFITYKSKVDTRDKFVVQSYHKALEAAQIYSLAWKFKLTLTGSEESELSSASEFDQVYEILSQVLQCIEFCQEFSFEMCILNLVEYCELIEQS